MSKITISGAAGFSMAWSKSRGWRFRYAEGEEWIERTKPSGEFKAWVVDWRIKEGKYGPNTIVRLQIGEAEFSLLLPGNWDNDFREGGTGVWIFRSLKKGRRLIFEAEPATGEAKADWGVIKELGGDILGDLLDSVDVVEML